MNSIVTGAGPTGSRPSRISEDQHRLSNEKEGARREESVIGGLAAF
jgi:hypothetical protein